MKKIRLNNTANKSADGIIDAIEARAKRQNRMYAVSFVVICLVVVGAILNSLSIQEYDGYISHQNVSLRAISRLSILDYHVAPGDVVNEGDTLYSYLMVDWLEDQANPFTDDLTSDKRKESDLRIAKYKSEIIEINNTIYTLHRAIEKIEEEIRSGIKTDDELINLNLELNDRIEKSEHLRRSITAEYDLQSKYVSTEIKKAKYLTALGRSERQEDVAQFGKALRYRVAYVDSKIIDFKAHGNIVCLQDEEILTFQPIGHPEMTNSHINMIVDANKYEEIADGMVVDVFAGGRFLCEARVSLLGVRMADTYVNMELLLDRSTEINGKLVVPLKFKEGYKLPEKYFIHNYPVEIRHRIWGDWSRRFNVKEWFRDYA